MVGGTDGESWFGSDGLWLLNLEGPFWYPQPLRCSFGASQLSIASHSADIIGDSLLLFGGLTLPNPPESVEASPLSKPAEIVSAIAKHLVASNKVYAVQIGTLT
jgi:hypothetical protein